MEILIRWLKIPLGQLWSDYANKINPKPGWRMNFLVSSIQNSETVYKTKTISLDSMWQSDIFRIFWVFHIHL